MFKFIFIGWFLLSVCSSCINGVVKVHITSIHSTTTRNLATILLVIVKAT